MDIRKIKKLIELLTETGISEIEIKEGEESLRLTRHTSPTHAQTITEHVVSAPATQHLTAIAPTEPKAASMPSGHKVHSPMVGTYYSALLLHSCNQPIHKCIMVYFIKLVQYCSIC